MEEPGFINEKKRRFNLWTIIIPSCLLLLVIIGFIQFSQQKKMETRSSIKGILQTTDGRPVEDAIVMIKEGPGTFNDIASVSNSQGEFFVSNIVIPGKYVLQIQHGNGIITKEINVQSGDTIIRINL